MVSFKRTYQIEDPPEAAIEWNEYEHIIQTEWADVLNSDPPAAEADVQAFLERHPSMVPGAFGILGNQSGHHPLNCGVLSQAPLPSYNRRVPDFMWLALNSDTEMPVLIEIEAPGKRWFTKSGTPTAQLTQALDQIVDWKAWFGTPHNVQAFKAFYRLDQEAWRGRRFRPVYLLVYGRRSEANAKPDLTKKRTHLSADDVVVMTYDRLSPDPKAIQLGCMKVNASGELTALTVPPTIRWRPGLARERARLDNLDEAIDNNPYISEERKRFLIRRLEYWNNWANRSEEGVINMADEE